MKFRELSKEDSNIGIRGNKLLISTLKNADIPISDVLKAGLHYFFSISDNDKVRYISDYSSSLIDKNIFFPEAAWPTLQKKFLEEDNKMENLYELLVTADDNDLEVLIKYQANESAYKNLNTKQERVMRLIQDIETNGGNTFLNMLRNKGIHYDEIVQDVAKQLKIKVPSSIPVDRLEELIAEAFMEENYKKMSPEEQKQFLQDLGYANGQWPAGGLGAALGLGIGKMGAFATYKLAVIAANYVSRLILGRGLAFVANQMLARGIALALGPIGWGFTALWGAFDLAGPAFSKTIPSVLHVYYLRQKFRQKQQPKCTSCAYPIETNAKFCSDCGTAV